MGKTAAALMTRAERETRDRIIGVIDAYLASAVDNDGAIEQLMEIQTSSKELSGLLSALQVGLDGFVARRFSTLSTRRRSSVAAFLDEVRLFLRSDLPYRDHDEIERMRADPIPSKLQLMLCLLTFGFYNRGIPAPAQESCWPFATHSERRQCLAESRGAGQTGGTPGARPS